MFYHAKIKKQRFKTPLFWIFYKTQLMLNRDMLLNGMSPMKLHTEFRFGSKEIISF